MAVSAPRNDESVNTPSLIMEPVDDCAVLKNTIPNATMRNSWLKNAGMPSLATLLKRVMGNAANTRAIIT